MASKLLCACAAGVVLCASAFVAGQQQVRGSSERNLQVVGGILSKLKNQEGVGKLLPFTDTACFIEEYAGLVGAMYDTEAFDREKAKAIIADYLAPIGLQSEVAKMLYMSMRELVPILALEPVSGDVFTAFESRISAMCNGAARRLQEEEQTAVELSVGLPSLVEEEEVSADLPALVEEEEAAADVLTLDEGGESLFGELKKEEEVLGAAAVDELIPTLVEGGGDVSADLPTVVEEEEAIDFDELLNEEGALDQLKKEEEAVEEVFPANEEELFVAVGGGEDASAKAVEGVEKSPEQTGGLSEALSVVNLQGVDESLLSNADSQMKEFLSQAVGADFDFAAVDKSGGGGAFRGAAAASMREGKRSCSILSTIDNRCFVIKYAGFVGASWGTREFDEQKAAVLLDTFVPISKLVGTVASLMCVSADQIMPLFAGDQTITPAAIDGFFAEVAAQCGPMRYM
eukprot:GHVS01032593.1.p1 GENE.GHVS01032593.1~~GHVS01032593.1.p1  ORF type:complete len:459 (-),score=153.09 GHVS01032593.1:336-1712(-)